MLLKIPSTVVQWRAFVGKKFANVDVIFAQYFRVRTFANFAYAYLHAFRRFLKQLSSTLMTALDEP
jgi:hypothetical protein